MRLKDKNETDKRQVEETVEQPEQTTEFEPPVQIDTTVKTEESEKPEKPKNTAFQSFLNKAGLSLLFLALGALAVALALYLPASSDLKKAQTEVDRLTGIEAQYTELQVNYIKVQQQSGVYKTISDTSVLQTALTERDTTKVNQQLRYVEDDLNALQIPDIPEVLQRLQSQFLKIKASAVSDPDKALGELGKFYIDLLSLADNLD